MADEDISEKKSDSKDRVRIELIFSQALEEDFQQEFNDNKIGKFYTKMYHVMGAGYSDPHLGDSIWPQLNDMYIIYCKEAEAAKIKKVVTKLRGIYKNEGIACFVSRAEEF